MTDPDPNMTAEEFDSWMIEQMRWAKKHHEDSLVFFKTFKICQDLPDSEKFNSIFREQMQNCQENLDRVTECLKNMEEGSKPI